MRTLGKRVNRKVSRVRIPPSPNLKRAPRNGGLFKFGESFEERLKMFKEPLPAKQARVVKKIEREG